MTPERWAKVDALFHEVLERAPEERDALLDGACAGDEPLRAEVESLLASYEGADVFLETPVGEMAAGVLVGAEARLTAGRRVGQYDVVGPLGEGGMGHVYLAEDSRLGRRAALKVLPSAVTADPERVRRFELEARATSSLNHPNVCVVYEVGETDDGRRFIAMEHVEGRTLRALLDDGPLEPGAALEIARQVALALAAAHEAGIVHRDVKPENLMLRPDGFVKVLDFGIAKLTEPRTPSGDAGPPKAAGLDTSPGLVLGTVAYMSPEQVRARAVDARSDIFSLGVVLYEMLAGHRPFEGETTSDLTAAILKTEPPPLLEVAPGVPEELERIVFHALRKDREERYQHVADLLAGLVAVKEDLDLAASLERSHHPDHRTGARGATPRRVMGEATSAREARAGHPASSAEYLAGVLSRHRAAAIVLVALAVALAAGGYFAFITPSTSPITSIAVMPFANGSGDDQLDYLSDGISEGLINSLARLGHVKVIARSSSFRFKGGEVDPRKVGEALGVGAVVTGRVVQRGGELRISVELVDARAGTQLWGEKFDRKAGEVQAVQEEIARAISERLRVPLSREPKRQLAGQGTKSSLAYEYYLTGTFHLRKRGLDNVRKALDYQKLALAEDPDFALAWTGVASAHLYFANFSLVDPKVALADARAAAEKAVEIDESLADAHLVLAQIDDSEWDFAGAERRFLRAIELSPNLADAHFWYSHHLSKMGRQDEAIVEIKRAEALDPLSARLVYREGNILSVARRYDEAITVLRRATEMEPGFELAYFTLAMAYAGKGMYGQALVEYGEFLSRTNETTTTQCYQGYLLAMAGRRDEARRLLRGLETTEAYVSPEELAALYAGLGDKDRAFATLERAVAARDLQAANLMIDGCLDSLRNDPRFADLERRVGLRR